MKSPNELKLLQQTARFAATATTCSAEKLPEAVSAVALVLGSERALRQVLSNDTAPQESKLIASRILGTFAKDTDSLSIRVEAPWRRLNFRRMLLRMADKSIETAVRHLRRDPDGQFVTEGLGFGMILEEFCVLHPQHHDRIDYLVDCSRQIEAILDSGDTAASIEFKPSTFDEQTYFDFFYTTP